MIDQRVLKPGPDMTSYTLSKAALWTATRTLAQALAPKIRVNAIGPGPTFPNWRDGEAGLLAEVAALPLKRRVDPADFGRAIRFLVDTPSITGQMLALDGGIQPRIMNLKAILEAYVKHRQEVVRRRTEFDLARAKERAHILKGLKIALDNLDAVIKTIKTSKDKDEAKTNLMRKFKLDEIQAQAILEMRLQRLTGLERDKVVEEYREVSATIESWAAGRPRPVTTLCASRCIGQSVASSSSTRNAPRSAPPTTRSDASAGASKPLSRSNSPTGTGTTAVAVAASAAGGSADSRRSAPR